MQATHPIPSGFEPNRDSRRNFRTGAAIATVAVIHATLLAVALSSHDRPVPIASEPRTITAELLSPAPVAAPVAVQSIPTPTPPKPEQHTKPKPRPTPKPHEDTPKLPTAAAPSPNAISTPEPAPPAPPAPAAPPAAAPAAPAIGKPTVAINAPKNVSHLDCEIVKTEYPMLSKRRGETGTAVVQFTVGVSGKIEGIQLKKSSGFDRLDDAALDAVRSSSCRPYMENGEAIRATTSVPYVFNLSD